MQVQNIECQLAQAQMARYLSGEALDLDLVTDLKRHVADCSTCQAALELRRRHIESEVGAVAAAATGGRTAVAAPPEQKSATIDKLLGAFQQKASNGAVAAQKPAEASIWKPLAYALALAAVLIAMSMMLRNPTRVLGDKALPSSGASPAAAQKQPPAPPKNDAPAKAESMSSKTMIAAAELIAQTPEPTPPPAVERPVARQQQPPTTAPRSRTPASSNDSQQRRNRPRGDSGNGSIKVYDSDGAVINPTR